MWICKAVFALAVVLFTVKAQELEETEDTAVDLCKQPNVVNGDVTAVTDSSNIFVGSVTCNEGYILVGKTRIKCVNGIWSSSTPVCTRMGSCEIRDLPTVKNARRIMVRPYRGSVVRYKCNRGYHLYGPHLFHCVDHKEWSHLEAPVCARRGCDETQMHQIAYGLAKKQEKGAVYQFECDEGAVLAGSPTVFCDGYKWNDTAPTCLIPPERLTIEGPEELTKEHPAHFTCKASASNLPSKLSFKVTSHHADLLSDLIKDDLVILEEPKESWVENPTLGVASGWASSRSLILRPALLERAGQLGEQITFECQVPDPYHERRILVSASKYVLLRAPVVLKDLSLHIDGPSEIRYNEIAQFRCSANRDNIELEWKLDHRTKSDIGKVELILQPGQIRHGERRVTLECSGMDENGDIVSVKHDVEVLYPPSIPEISGKARVSLGYAQKLTCTSQAGYPTAKLSWFRGSAMMESHYSVEGDVVKAEVTFVPKPEDDGSQLRCEAVNEAVSKPVYNTITIELMPSPTTTTSTTTTTTMTTTSSTNEMEIIDENTVQQAATDIDYENYDYYDDDIFDSYPTDPSMSSDPEFTHPELENIPFFTGKIPFPPTTQEPIRVQSVDDNLVVHKSDKTQMEIEEANWKKNQNEVFPKDAPYTQSASKTVNSVSFCVLLSIIWLQLAN